MKKIKFILISLIVIFSFNINVKAALVCGNNNKNAVLITMNEKIDNAGYNVKVPVCNYSTKVAGWQTVDLGEHNEYIAVDVDQAGYDLITRAQEDAYAKGYTSVQIAKCADPKAYLTATTSCEKIIGKATLKTKCAKWKCQKKDKEGNCEVEKCTKWDTYYECSTGDVEGAYCVISGSTSFTIPRADATVARRYVYSNVPKAPTGYFFTYLDDCVTTFALKCPIYKCVYAEEIIDACTPSYKTGGDTAYCVNPAQAFPHDGSNKNYQIDTGFNINSCTTSYSTIDCGYGNILVEAEYYKSKGVKVSDSAINTALRLWGAYTNQAGYGKAGLANRKGDGCGEGIVYIPQKGGGIINVYKATSYYINKNFRNVAHSKEYIAVNDELWANFNKITCDAGLGITCSYTRDSKVYGQAADLFFNTVIGNKELQNHIRELFGTIDTNPDNISLVSGETSKGYTKTWFEYRYEEFENLGVTKEVYDCKEVRTNKDKKYTKAERDAILPYCQVKTQLVDASGKVVDEVDILECIKGSGCRTEEFEVASCEKSGQAEIKVRMKITYTENRSSSYLQKYWACASTSSSDDSNQVLFAFKKGYIKDIDLDKLPERERKEIFTLRCGGYCQETGAKKMSNSGYANGKCVDKLSGEYRNETTFDNSIKDPSLKCIVNMNEGAKEYYDYSNYFGVNSDMCRVYCSDEVEFTLSNKINAAAGETFVYDIGFATYESNDIDHKLSGVVKEKRTCISEVYYTKELPDNSKKYLTKKYNLKSKDLDVLKDKEINNIADLLIVLSKKGDSEGGRQENVNEVIYDLYNCYFLKKDAFNKLKKPQNIIVENVYNNMNKLYGASNNYGYDNRECTMDVNDKKQNCINMEGLRYDFGAEDLSGRRINEIYLKDDPSSLLYERSNVQYCYKRDPAQGDLCLNYKKDDDKHNYDYSNFINESNIKMKKWGNYELPDCSQSNSDSIRCDYALFNVSVKVGFYNKHIYQTTPGQGYIIDVTDGGAKSEYLTLDKYSYPISKNAINNEEDYCEVIAEDAKHITKRCEVTYVVGGTVGTPMIFTFYRKQEKDEFFRKINSSDNNFVCSVDVKIPKVSTCKDCELEDATIYRNVSPADIFPNNISYDDTNWATQEGQIAKNAIETTSDDLRFNKNLLDYSISLSAAQIRALREYNSNNKDYINEDIHDCENDEDMYINCRSNLLDILRGTTTTDSSIYGTIDPDYNGKKYFSR